MCNKKQKRKKERKLEPFICNRKKQKIESRIWLIENQKLVPIKMEVDDLKLRNQMRCAIKFFHRLGKTAQEIVKLMKEAEKDKCFGECRIFRWHD